MRGGGGESSLDSKTQVNDTLLRDTFRGVYPGSEAKSLTSSPIDSSLAYSKAMLGIPSLKRDSDKDFKQSLEKILFPLQNKRFRIMLVAESYNRESIQEIIGNLFELSSEVHSLVKQSKNKQGSMADTQGRGATNTEGSSESESYAFTTSTSHTEGENKLSKLSAAIGSFASIASVAGTAIGAVYGGPVGMMVGGYVGGMTSGIISKAFGSTTLNTSDTTSESNTRTNTTSTNQSRSINTNESQTKTITLGITYEEINKNAEYCEKLIEAYIERFQKGLNHGLWNASLYIQSDDLPTLSQVEHTLKSVYGGDNSYFEPIRFSDVIETNALIESNQCELHKLPMLYANGYENPIHTSFSGFGTAINTEELSLLAAMPTKDIQGLQVTQSSHFALTQSPINKDDEYIHIGNVLQRGERTPQRFRISLNALNHHLFISGITGGGKSNSIKQILCRLQNVAYSKIIEDSCYSESTLTACHSEAMAEESLKHKRDVSALPQHDTYKAVYNEREMNLNKKIPFLVIEPAKSEYKHLKTKIEDLQIFSPGSSNDILRLNPFVFEKQSELTSHVDMLKATFVAAFPMEGPMPYILESALHRIYTDKGWDFISESHLLFVDSTQADATTRSLLFPTMNDLYSVIDSVVAESGYASELDSNLKAALKTRIKNLTLGVKGKIYNTRHCFSSKLLFDKPTIIELSNIADDCEKSFLMGILLNRLYQYRQRQGDSNNALKHICVIEEAHRLLPNIALDRSSSEANAKGAAVQVFINNVG